MLAEVKGSKPPELLLETTEQMLARMKARLQPSKTPLTFPEPHQEWW
jgi:hypothetical protein